MARYIILEEVSLPTTDQENNPIDYRERCSHCDRDLIHYVVLKDNQKNTERVLGRACVEKFCGSSIKEIKDKIKDEIQEEESIARGIRIKARENVNIKTFAEVNEDIFTYIEENKESNSFILACYKMIQEKGTLTNTMLSWVMVAKNSRYSNKTPIKVKDKTVNVFLYKFKANGFEGSNSLFAIDENNEIIEIFFSSLNKVGSLLQEKGILTKDSTKISGYKVQDKLSFENPIQLNISGSYDGYKLKRVKISK